MKGPNQKARPAVLDGRDGARSVHASGRGLYVAAQLLRSTQQVSDIVSDLLDYSTSHLSGSTPVALAQYDVSAECRSVVQEMKLFHPEREFRVEVEDDIGVFWDRAHEPGPVQPLGQRGPAWRGR